MTEKAYDFEERLNAHPILKKRMMLLFEIVEDRAGNYNRADEAEEKIVEQVREMGNELMHIWALEKESVRVKEIKKSGDITAHGKKNFIGIRHSE